MSNGWRQLFALLIKNFKIKIRTKIQTFLEFCSPIILLALLVLGWYLSGEDYYPAKHYADQPIPFMLLPTQLAGSVINGLQQQAATTQSNSTEVIPSAETCTIYLAGICINTTFGDFNISELNTTEFNMTGFNFTGFNVSDLQEFIDNLDTDSFLNLTQILIESENENITDIILQVFGGIMQIIIQTIDPETPRDFNTTTIDIDIPPPLVEVFQNLTETTYCIPIGNLCLNFTVMVDNSTVSEESTSAMEFTTDQLDMLVDMIQAFLFYEGPMPMLSLDAYMGMTQLSSTGQAAGNMYFEEVMSRMMDMAQGLDTSILLLFQEKRELSFAPDTPEVREMINFLNLTSSYFDNVFYKLFDTCDDGVQETRERDDTWAFICVESLDIGEDPTFEYTIRMKHTNLPSTKFLENRFVAGLDYEFQKYWYSGFLTLQKMLDDYILASTNNFTDISISPPVAPLIDLFFSNTSSIDMQVMVAEMLYQFTTNLQDLPDVNISTILTFLTGVIQDDGGSSTSNIFITDALTQILIMEFETALFGPQFMEENINPLWAVLFPTAEYDSNVFYGVAGPLMGIVAAMSTMYPVSRLIKNIVEEKETRMKETMKIMGLVDWAWQSSWLITYYLMFLFQTIIICILFKDTVFSNSDPILIGLFFALFMLSEVVFSYLITVFFSKSKLASIIGPILLFGAILPRFIFFGNEAFEGDVNERLACSLLSPSAFTFGADLLSKAEGANLGMTWETLDQGIMSFQTILLMLIIDTIIYLLLALYLEQVLPSEFGVKKKPWFIFNPLIRLYKKLMKIHNEEEVINIDFNKLNYPLDPKDNQKKDRPPLFKIMTELRGSDEEPSIVLTNLTKVFKSVKKTQNRPAVDHLSMKIFSNEIFCLLGPNGAGKSTTISLITALYGPTSGSCKIHGLDTDKDLEQVRQMIGLCPQQNVIFPTLTVRENLYLFARLKGIYDRKILKKEVEQYMKLLDLSELANSYAGAMSGGQKRKLCCAIAFIGGSKVVILDEPSSGLDPLSRHRLWSTIRESKQGRTIILTTHFLDEADVLGDVIAIMTEGHLTAMGSPLYLKSKYGVGYCLSLVKDKISSQNTDDTIVQDKSNSNKILDILAKHVPDVTLLDESQSEIQMRLPFTAVSKFSDMFTELDTRQQEMSIKGYGISMTTLEEVFFRVADKNHISVETDISKKDTTEDKYLHEIQTKDKARTSSYLTQFIEMMKKRIICAYRDWKGRFFEVILPIVVVAFVLIIVTLPVDISGPPLVLTPLLYAKDPSVNIINVPVNTSLEMSYYLLDTYSSHSGNRWGALVADDEFTSVVETEYNENTIVKRDSEFTIMHNSTFIHALPSYVSEVTNIVLKTRLIEAGRNHSNARIITRNHPLPLEIELELRNNTILTLLAALFLLIPFTFLPAQFSQFLVKERVVGSKHAQFLTNLNPIIYWFSSYLWDMINFTFIVFISMIIFALYDTDFTLNWMYFFATVSVFLAYGASVIPLSYILSFMFRSHSSAQVGIALFHFLLGFVLVITSFILDGIDDDTRAVNAVLKVYVFRLIPPFCFGEGLINVASHKFRVMFMFFPDDPFHWLISMRAITYMLGQAVFYFSLLPIIEYRHSILSFFGLSLLPQYISRLIFTIEDFILALPRKLKKRYQNVKKIEEANTDDPNDEKHKSLFAEDESVKNERDSIIKGDIKDSSCYIKGLRKVYDVKRRGRKLVAVDNLYMKFPKDVAFGLLGANGSGKTTTLSILTGDRRPTAGEATLGGYNILTQQAKSRTVLGYCPQEDPILELMTTRETLSMYCKLRGTSFKNLNTVVESMMKRLALWESRDRRCGELSGGNKRKLSLGIALAGNPQIMILDEPTTGVDAVARAFIRELIRDLSKSHSVITTTHSIEDCEAVCGRVAVLSRGRLISIGSVQELKNRFGQGYYLEIRTKTMEKIPEIKTFVETTFSGTRVDEEHGGMIKFILDKKVDHTLAHMFGSIENVKDSLCIVDYSLSQSTLEQVFVTLARHAEEQEAEWERLRNL